MMQPSSASTDGELHGKIGICYASSFFHLFTLDQQVELATQVVGLLRPQKGSSLVSRQLGSVKPGEYPLRKLEEGKLYRHNVASFAQMWKIVGNATGNVWSVKACLDGED